MDVLQNKPKIGSHNSQPCIVFVSVESGTECPDSTRIYGESFSQCERILDYARDSFLEVARSADSDERRREINTEGAKLVDEALQEYQTHGPLSVGRAAKWVATSLELRERLTRINSD